MYGLRPSAGDGAGTRRCAAGNRAVGCGHGRGRGDTSPLACLRAGCTAYDHPQVTVRACGAAPHATFPNPWIEIGGICPASPFGYAVARFAKAKFSTRIRDEGMSGFAVGFAVTVFILSQGRERRLVSRTGLGRAIRLRLRSSPPSIRPRLPERSMHGVRPSEGDGSGTRPPAARSRRPRPRRTVVPSDKHRGANRQER